MREIMSAGQMAVLKRELRIDFIEKMRYGTI